MTGVPAPVGPKLPPAAWTLPRTHKALCPGSHEPCVYQPDYRSTTCPVCGERWVSAYPVPSIAGGGRVEQHYSKTDGPVFVPREPVLEGQLALNLEETCG